MLWVHCVQINFTPSLQLTVLTMYLTGAASTPISVLLGRPSLPSDQSQRCAAMVRLVSMTHQVLV